MDTSAYDITLATTVTIIAIAWHRISIELFAPTTPLYQAGESATNLNGGQLAAQWFEIGTVWLPVIVVCGIWTWVLMRAFRRPNATGQARRPR